MKNIFLICFLLLFAFVNGQNIKFKTLSTDNGLSNNSVNDIVSDKDGMLWIATWDGLNLYDGHQFKVFKHIQNDSTSISGNGVFQIIKDGKDSLWLFTDDKKINQYLGNGKFNSYVFDMVPDKLYLSKDDNVLVANKSESSCYEYKDGKFIEVSKKRIKRNDNAALNEIIRLKFPNLIINESLQDSKGNIWYATRRNGLYIIPNNSTNIHNEQVEHYKHDSYSTYSFTSNEIEKLYEDDFGNVWLGHKDGGLSMAYNNSHLISTVIPHPIRFSHLPNETIRAVTKDVNSKIWLGYYTKGLYFFSEKTNCYLKYDISKSTENKDWDRIRSLYTTSDQSVWAGTYGGLIRIKNNQTLFYDEADELNLPNNRTYSFFEDTEKQLWVACWGGLAKFNLNSGEFEKFKGQEKLKDLFIRKVVVNDDHIILGTENKGVVILHRETAEITNITVEDKILGNSIYNVLKDDDTGYYWIASLGGVSVFDLKSGIVKNIAENDGLPSHMVYSLLLNNNKIWVSTTKGIAAIDKNTYAVQSLNPDEGWQAAEFSEGAYFQDRKGTLFFGGINGLNYFSPTLIDFSVKSPKIKVLIDDNKEFPEKIEKPFINNDLKVEIIPVSYTKDANNKVLYKLLNYDKKWHVFTKNPIEYRDLPHGIYTLEIKNSLDKSENAITRQITINKPFYKTILFYVSLLILLLLVGAYVMFIKNINARKRQRLLEEKIVQRTKTINAQKENLLVVNNKLDEKNKEIIAQKEQLLKLHHHLKNEDFEIEKFKTFVLSEFKPPISNILETSNNLQNQNSIKKELLKQTGKLINSLLEWDYLNQVKDIGNQKKAAVKLGAILKKPLDSLKKQAAKSEINLEVFLDVKNTYVALDVLRFKLLFNYLLNDIIKYAEINCELKIDVKNIANSLTINIVSDSKVLMDNFYSIQHYSPYFKAANTLITALDGQIEINKEYQLSQPKDTKSASENILSVRDIPIAIRTGTCQNIEQVKPGQNKLNILIALPTIDTQDSFIEEGKQLNVEDELKADKNNILVLCEENDFVLAKQIIEGDDSNILLETSVEGISSAVNHINIHVLVLYNITLTNKLISLLNQLKNNDNQIALPVIYISEQINYFLQEQAVDIGVDVFIQLPVNKVFIQKKIRRLLKMRKDYLKNKLKKQFFNINSDKEVLSNNEKLIKKALQIIKENLNDPSFNVEKLGEILEVSKIKCYRIFKEVLKKSPSDIIVNLRLQKATFLLKNKTLNISEVCYECGFNDPKYFGRLFKKKFGYSPKEFKGQV